MSLERRDEKELNKKININQNFISKNICDLSQLLSEADKMLYSFKFKQEPTVNLLWLADYGTDVF